MNLWERSMHAAIRNVIAVVLVSGAGCGINNQRLRIGTPDGNPYTLFQFLDVRCSLNNKDCVNGMGYLWQRQYQLAAQYFERAAQADSTDHNAIFLLGVAYQGQGEYDKARAQYSRAIGMSDKRVYRDQLDLLNSRPEPPVELNLARGPANELPITYAASETAAGAQIPSGGNRSAANLPHVDLASQSPVPVYNAPPPLEPHDRTTRMLSAHAEGSAQFSIRTTSSGNSEQEAMNHAFDQAVDKIVDTYAPNYLSKGRELHWIRHLMKAHPQFVVGSHYEVVDRRGPVNDPVGRQWHVTLTISVPNEVLDTAWNEAKEFIEWIGSPTVGVAVNDRIEDNRRRPKESFEEDGDTAQQFVEELQRQHFDVKEISQLEVLRPVHGEFARLNDQSVKAISEILSKQSVDILVAGEGRAMGPTPHHRTPGRTGFDWESDAKCKIYWTDEATLIAALNADGLGEDNDQDRGRVTALKNVATQLAADFVRNIFREWSIWAYEGRAVTVTVLGCTNSQSDNIEDVVASLPNGDVTRILDVQYANDTTTLRMMSKRAPRVLSRALREARYDGFKLAGTEARSNTIRLKVIN